MLRQVTGTSFADLAVLPIGLAVLGVVFASVTIFEGSD